ncbi:LysR family transcriptional regulator [Luteibacter rhizovicinus]|nr:LysR family transcriptional regulator [Luteibacter rhizovicinus]
MKRTNNMADLFLLVQVIEAGSFSVAAEQLQTTRSLLSRRIKTLERRLGVQLLHRNARRFSVTPIGEEIYRHASAMCESAMAAEHAATDINAGSRSLRVHVHSLLMPLMSSILPGFSADHPQMRVSLTTSNGDFEPLIRQQADVVLSVSDSLPDSTDVVARLLTHMPTITVAAHELVRRLGPSPSVDRIADRDVLAYAGLGAPMSLLLRPSKQGEARMVTSDIAVLLASVRAGLGFARLPACLCEEDIQSGRLAAVQDATENAGVPVHALTMSARAVTDAALAFVRFTQERLSVRIPE